MCAARQCTPQETEALVESKLSAVAAHDAPRSTKDLLATVRRSRARIMPSRLPLGCSSALFTVCFLSRGPMPRLVTVSGGVTSAAARATGVP